MRKKHALLWMVPVLASLILSAAGPAAAKAAGNEAAGETVTAAVFSSPQSMKLPHNTASYWFIIPAGTKLGDGCSLTLRMKAAATLLTDYSSVTLLVNDVQVASVRLADVVENGEGSWAVPIPAARLKTDGTLNKLSIVTAQRSILGDCADIDNPSNWVTLEDTSTLSLNVLKEGDPQLGSVLPYYFNRVDQMDRISSEFVLPSATNADTCSAMLNVAAASGTSYPAKSEVSFAVSQGSSAGTEQNRILIGLGSQKPSGLGDLPSLSAGNGFLATARSGGFNNLLIYGFDAAGLSKAAAFFTHSQYLAQLSGSSTVIATDLTNRSPASVKKDDGYYTLSDFGYDTVNLAGAFHQQTTFALKQPQDIRSGNDSYVEIHFRHSAALVGDTSLLTVYVNDVAVSSIQLSSSNASGGKIRAAIPSGTLDSSTVNIKVDCYNYLGKIDCSKDYYDTAWTVVDKSSVVYFEPGSTALAPTLKQFPVFDSYASGGTGTAVLAAPKNASPSLLGTAAELACRAGQNTGSAFRWQYTDDLAGLPLKSTSDILILGNGGTAVPDEVAKQLAAVPHADGSYTISASAPVTAEALRDKIVIQAVRSPWNFSRRVYVVTCPSGMESELQQFVSKRDGLDRLGGTMALIDAAGNVTNISAAPAAQQEKIPFSFDRTVSWLVRTTGVSRVGLIVILVCIIVIILLIIRAISNRRRFVHAKEKVERVNSGVEAAPPEKQELKKKDDSLQPDNFDDDKDDRL